MSLFQEYLVNFCFLQTKVWVNIFFFLFEGSCCSIRWWYSKFDWHSHCIDISWTESVHPTVQNFELWDNHSRVATTGSKTGYCWSHWWRCYGNMCFASYDNINKLHCSLVIRMSTQRLEGQLKVFQVGKLFVWY